MRRCCLLILLLPWMASAALACQPRCSDGLDNDGDGFIDHDGGAPGPAFADPDCVDGDDTAEAWQPGCHEADVNDDGTVDVDDIVAWQTGFGDCPPGGAPCPGDTNGDGTVGIDDQIVIFQFWGVNCNAPPPPELVRITAPAHESYLDVASPALEYGLLPGASVTEMRLDGSSIPLLASGTTLALPGEGTYTLRIDAEDSSGVSSTATTRFTYSTEDCPFRRSALAVPATCDVRLMLQGKYTDADLSVFGMNNRAISLYGSWFHLGGDDVSPQEFIDEDYDDIVARLSAIISNPERGLQQLTTSDDMVLIDIESPEPLHRYTGYLDDPALLTQMLEALKRRVDAAHAVMPNAKLLLWGFQPHPRGDYGQGYLDRVNVFNQAGNVGLYDNLYAFTPLLYSHYGPTDYRRVTVGATTYDVRVFYDHTSQIGEEFTFFFHFHLGGAFQAAGGIFTDPGLPEDSVTLGGTSYTLSLQAPEFFLTGPGEQAALEVSPEYFLETTENYVTQGMTIVDDLRDNWPLPAIPLFSTRIYEVNTAHRQEVVPTDMARLMLDTVQSYPFTEAATYWFGDWAEELPDFFAATSLLTDPCGCGITQCTDRFDNDLDGRTDRYDPGCLAGPTCARYAPWRDDEGGFNLPPETTILDPAEDPIIIEPGSQVTFVGTVVDPEGETWLSPTWTFGDPELDDRGGLSPTVTFADEGRFVVRLNATDSDWASDPSPARRDVAVCFAPTQPAEFVGSARSVEGHPVLELADSNPPGSTTGYNVYRATNPSGPLVLHTENAQDADPATPGFQFVDAGPAVPDSAYYRAAPYNATCEIEGPRDEP